MFFEILFVQFILCPRLQFPEKTKLSSHIPLTLNKLDIYLNDIVLKNKLGGIKNEIKAYLYSKVI